MGGWSAERDVSLVTGQAAVNALNNLGYRVSEVDANRDLVEQLKAVQPDVVFNALHGRWGEDGCIQGILEVLNIPYTHSGVMASAVAMDKPMAKKLFERVGIPCAAHKIVTYGELAKGDPLPRPYVVKPINEGSSVGVEIVQQGDNQPSIPTDKGAANRPVMVEQYIPGRELACGILDGRALAVTELIPKRGFYDYEAKYTEAFAREITPAPISDELEKNCRDISERLYKALKCKGVVRFDYIFNDSGIYFLEVNTVPGLSPKSIVPKQSLEEGIPLKDLFTMILNQALAN